MLILIWSGGRLDPDPDPDLYFACQCNGRDTFFTEECGLASLRQPSLVVVTQQVDPPSPPPP